MNFMKKKIFDFDKDLKKWKTKFNPENYKVKKFSEEVTNFKSKKIIVEAWNKN